MAITTLLQTQIVDGVNTIVVGPVTQDITDDQWSGQYTRTIQVFGPPTGNAPNLLFTLQIYGPTEASIELTAPSAQF